MEAVEVVSKGQTISVSELSFQSPKLILFYRL